MSSVWSGATVERYGRLDVAFNNAGFQERRAPIEQQGSSVYDDVFDANVRSIFLCLRHQLPVMFARGEGSIVVNASVSGIRNPNAGLSLYSASKAAAISLMRSAAMEAAPRGVRINAIAPGRVVTDMMLRSGVGDMSAVAAGLPLRRMGQPDEVAEAVIWLLVGRRVLCGRPCARRGRRIFGVVTTLALLRVKQRHRRIHHHLDQADAVMRQAALQRRRELGRLCRRAPRRSPCLPRS